MWDLASYFRKYRGRLVCGFLLLMGANALGISIPWLIKDAIEGLRAGLDLGVIRWSALAIGIAAVIQGGCTDCLQAFVPRREPGDRI